MKQVGRDENTYWAEQTFLAIENFQISGYKLPHVFISAYSIVKKACALANEELGFLDPDIAKAIICACDEISSGKRARQFPLDAFQGGAGTSTNMNINEVIANRALELLGYERGRFDIIDPIEHVNKHQSTNDTFVTALKIAAIWQVRDLSNEIAALQGICQSKEKEFWHIVKIGRTEMQDAVPMTLGAQFSSFADAFARDRWRVFKIEERLRSVNLGGTAIGTGLTAPRKYIFLVIEKLRELTGIGLMRSENIISETANMDSLVESHGILCANAVNLNKMANDLRLMNLLGEISLPKTQMGSSIMPGKVNPVVCEAVMQAGIRVIANNSVLSQAAAMGSFQINEFAPLIAFTFLETCRLLINSNKAMKNVVKEIRANEENCKKAFDNSLSIVTAFLPDIGYSRAEGLLKEYESLSENNLSFRKFLESKLGPDLVEKRLSPESLLKLGF